jgi:hypothetical protein
MARRKSKAKPRSRTAKNVNILNIGESALLANAVTQGLFNVNLMDFVRGTKNYGSDGSSVMSLPELLGFGSSKFGGNYATGRTFQTQIVQNFKDNGMTMATSLILIPIGFTVASKLTKKPRATANKLLKMTGLGVKV